MLCVLGFLAMATTGDVWQKVIEDPARRALVLQYLAGEISKAELLAARLAHLAPYRKASASQRRQEIIIPTDPTSLEYFGGGPEGPCEGREPRGPAVHAFRVPSYISAVYRKVIYDPSAESWAQEWDGPPEERPELGVSGEPVGVAYTGFLQRIWGHGFYIELETDPIGGSHQRIELVHFREEDCDPLPGITLPCIKVKDLYTFTWSVRDAEFQVRKADSQWRSPFNLLQFYWKAREIMVAGTAASELRNLDGFDAGYADGSTSVFATSEDFPWYPCGDFSFQAFHARTQKRFNPWPGKGMPLLVHSRAKVTDKQRQRTAEDFEASRGQASSHDVAAGTAAVLGADEVDPELLATDDFSKRATREAMEVMQRYQEELVLLGQAFPDAAMGEFARMALRTFNHQRLAYVFDLDRYDPECLCFPKRDELAAKLPVWAYESITNAPGKGFSYAVLEWVDIDWTPPFLEARYAAVLNHPHAIIPSLNNLDDRAAAQTEMVKNAVRTTSILDQNPDPSTLSTWPSFAWPDTEDPDTYWSIYLTWD